MRAAAALATALALGASPTTSDGLSASFSAFQDGDATRLFGLLHRAGSTPDPTSTAGRQRARRVVVAGCYGTADVASAGSLCDRAIQICTAPGQPARTLYYVYTGPEGVASPAPDQWEMTGQFCSSPDQTPGAAVPSITAEQFRRLPVPAGIAHVQPGNGRTLVNVATNVYVDARVVVLPTTVLGQAVRVRATPVGYSWSFGDGGRLDTRDPGAPYPDLRTTHTYTSTGAMTVALITTYRGQYSVSGGPWQPIDGTATVASPSISLAVVAAHPELVQDPLPT